MVEAKADVRRLSDSEGGATFGVAKIDRRFADESLSPVKPTA
jgi:hypothetical protein